ncbi:hypothetical protein GTID1_17940 [Geobacillus thermodenitrificans]|nr:hypothetical protein GTID1_17940 [Geobacillus thermodenitrificans]
MTMVLLFFVVAPFAGKSFIEKELSGGVNFLVFSLMQGITFAAGVYVVLAGALVTGAPLMGVHPNPMGRGDDTPLNLGVVRTRNG